MAARPCEEDQDVYSISVVSDKGNCNRRCPSPLTFFSFLEVPYPCDSQACLDTDWNCKNCVSLQTESADRYPSCSVDIDIDQDNFGTPETEERTVCCPVKTESAPTRASQRKISLQIGGKMMQLLLNHSLILLKSPSKAKAFTGRVHDTPNSIWRGYKRAASLDSRKVALLFSILSSMGTMVLIYLTLRVKQIGDGLVHV